MILTLLLACGGKDTARESAAPVAEPWEIVADGIPGGTLLSAWTDGDVLRFVGGDMSSDANTGVMVEYDGERACVHEGFAARTLWWLHGAAPGDWYAVGAAGTILHTVGGVTTDESVPTEATLFGVYAADDGRVWAVGGDVWGTGEGEIWLRDGGVWSPFASGLPGLVFKAWDGWFVGDGRSWRLEGDALVEQAVPEGAKLLTARGRAVDDVYAVGGLTSPVVLHSTGTDWEEVSFDLGCSSQPLTGTWTAPGEDVWIAGLTGAMGYYDGTTWSCPDAPITFEHFHAVWSYGGAMWWAGGNLLSSGNNYGTIGRFGDPIGAVPVEVCP